MFKLVNFLGFGEETGKKAKQVDFLAKPTRKHEKAIKKKQYIFRDQQRREIGQWLPAREKKLRSDSSSVVTGTVFTVGRFALRTFARKFIPMTFFF